MFFHETREVKDDYGPAAGEHRTKMDTFALTDEEVTAFAELIKGGKIKSRNKAEPISGDLGPWMYLYWSGRGSEGWIYEFASYDKRLSFEDFCSALADK